MSKQQCVRCEHDCDAFMCVFCEKRVRRALHDIERFTRLIDSAEQRTTAGSEVRTAEKTLGVNIEALDVIAGNDTLPLLESWEVTIRNTYGLTRYGMVTEDEARADMLHNRIAFLKAWLHVLIHRQFEQLPALHDSLVAEAVRLARIACVDDHQGWRVECPNDVGASLCRHRVRVTRSDLQNDAEVVCRGCERVWTARRLVVVSAAANDVDVWVDADTLAHWYGVTKRTLRRWASEGLIERRGRLYSDRSMRKTIALRSL